MMKRILFLLALSISVLGTSAQNVEGLIKQYRHEKHADYVHIPRLVMSLARLFVRESPEDVETVKAVSSIRILSLEECMPAVKERFRNTVQTFLPAGYIPVIYTKEGGETCRIYVKERKGCIREVLLLSTDKDDGCIVQIKGKIKPGDVGNVIEQNTKKGIRKRCNL